MDPLLKSLDAIRSREYDLLEPEEVGHVDGCPVLDNDDDCRCERLIKDARDDAAEFAWESARDR